MIDRYTKCQVEWQEPNAPIIDPAPPRSIAEQVDDSYANNNDDSYNTNEKIVDSDDSYNTNEKIVEADDSYNTNDKLVAAGDSYNTNGKIVDQSSPVTCASPPAAKVPEDNAENHGDAFDLREEDKAEQQTGQY